MQLLRSAKGQLVRFNSAAPLGVGGEARIYAVADDDALAAKVYHRPTSDHAAKLAAMLANPPEDPMASQGHVSIAWPADLLTAPDGSGPVLGFLMRRVTGMSPIIDFYHPKTRRRKHPLFNYRYLLRTASNLAACVTAIHARGHVIGDLNESNILVGETALVTLVDTDSFQVPDPRNGAIYRCRVGKAEFTPPELQGVRFAWVDRKQEQDLFGLGVLFFQLLMEGVHPFAGRQVGPGEPASLEERIAAGAFPYVPGVRGRTRPMPTAPNIELLHPRIRRLFFQCFVTGRAHPLRRPDAKAWQQALLEAESFLITCPVNDQHLFGSHLAVCPWCERQEVFKGLDSFPSREAVKRGHNRRLILRGRRPMPASVIDYQTAVAIALATIAQRRRTRILTTSFFVVVVAGLLAYGWWAVHLAMLGQ